MLSDRQKLSKESINRLSFSSSTVFPPKEKLPKFFNPKDIINKRLKFNLHPNLDDSHITMAIIDNPTQFYWHSEFKGLNYELIDYSQPDADTHFHMDGVLNNIVGKTNGYSRNAKLLLYVVDWNSVEARTNSHLKALKDVFERIERGEKIQVVSISNMLIDRSLKGSTLEKEILEMVEKLKNNPHCRCEVVDSAVFGQFAPVSSDILDDCNDVDNYKLPVWCSNCRGAIIVNNIRPEFGSKDGYIVETDCGASWAIPQLSYLYAVSRKYADYTIEEFKEIAYSCCIQNKHKVAVLDVNQLIDKLIK